MPKSLRRLPDDGRLITNACHNRGEAIRMFEAGFTPAEIAREFPRVWRLTPENTLSQKYDSEYRDGRKETRISMLSSAVDELISKRRVS